MSANNPETPTADDLVLARLLDAPKALVFEAWTNPQRLAAWWGPDGFANPVCEADARPGGAIRIHMRAPDGIIYRMGGTFHEVVASERLVFTSVALDDAGESMFEVLNTVEFAEEDGRTRLTVRARVLRARNPAETAPYLAGMQEGWTQSLGRLATATSSREILTTRLIGAPRDLVWKAWTEPEHLAQWWGPQGFSNTFHTFDLRPGGEWRFTMRGPDGTDYQNRMIFAEIEAPARLVLDHVSGPRFRAEATFTDRDGQTELSFRMTFASVEEFERMKGVVIDGNRQTFDRLEDQAALLSGPTLAISRNYDAPRDLVWKAWTEPERLAQWWGPQGLAMSDVRLDLRAGGLFHYSMTTPEGHRMWGKFVYRDIVAPQRLAFVASFSDQDAGTRRPPMGATWPLEVLNLVTFTEQDGRTMVTLQGVPIHATDEERRTFEGGLASMRQGFAGTLDQLETYLAKRT
jgi:uncharacterized protein YndB with AHSA1/START domain